MTETYQGKPCKYGHSGVRYISNGNCIDCQKERREDPAFRKANKLRRLEYPEYYKLITTRKRVRQRKRRLENPEKYRLKIKIWRENNSEHYKSIRKKKRLENPEYYRLAGRKWRQNNPEKHCLKQSIRRFKRKLCMPKWSDIEKIKSYYIGAARLTKETGVKYSVDHIIPIAGKNICGLHVHYNLQILTVSDNSKKGNKFIVR